MRLFREIRPRALFATAIFREIRPRALLATGAFREIRPRALFATATFREIRPRALLATATLGALVALPTALWSAGDLSRQTPIEVTVDLGKPGQHVFVPREIKFETGKLYKLILRNPSDDPHYFTSDAFSGMIFTRKVQVTQQRDGKSVTLAEFKGAIREIEVYPGHAAEWWFVPVAAGRVKDLRCGIVKDGKTHAELGMTGEIVIE